MICLACFLSLQTIRRREVNNNNLHAIMCHLSVPWDNVNKEIIINILRQRPNGQRFPDDILKGIFSNENVCIASKMLLKFVTMGPVNNIPSLVQIMAWRRQATSHYLNQCWLVYRRTYTLPGLNELMDYENETKPETNICSMCHRSRDWLHWTINVSQSFQSITGADLWKRCFSWLW